MEWIFLILILFLVYTYLGYPLLLALLTARRPPPRPSPQWEPSVSLLIPAYNEEGVIEAKLRNALALDYPSEKLEIVVASDGSTDRTVELMEPFLAQGVGLVSYPEQRGKMAVINRTVPSLKGEVIVFTDASAFFPPTALRHLLAQLSDPQVGAVSGALVLKEETDPDGRLAVDAYWRLEKFIRERESCLFSGVGATGAIYALRRELFSPLPEDTILDDVLIPLEAVRRGLRIAFAGQALAYEAGHTDPRTEFRRKVRTLAGNYQVFARAPWTLIPFRSPIAAQMISHKLLRLLAPFALLGLLITSAASLSSLWPLFLLQLLFYALAGVGWIYTRRGQRPPRLFSLPLTFSLLNGAALVAFITRFIRGRDPTWR